jgi:hypothetical protein
MVAVFFTGSLVAQAAEITFGGQLRPRYEVRQNTDGNTQEEGISMRTRLNTKIKVDEKISAFIQFQMNSQWGGGVGATGFNPRSGNDSSTEVGLHQAYMTMKNLFGMPVTAKIGRQEIVLDGHRLFGHTGWLQGAQSHDAGVFTHSHEKMTLYYAYSKTVEGTDAFDEQDFNTHIGWVNFKGLIGGSNSSSSAYLVYSDDDTAKPFPGSTDFWTIGGRHAGGAGAVDYRGEFYYQTGQISDRDITAYMFGGRAGYKMSNVEMKPKFTFWFDYLSGTPIGATDFESFNTLFDTGHKFYGLQDIFVPLLNGAHPGLIDIAIKLALSPMDKVTFKADFHHFTAAEDFAGPVVIDDKLGQELDLTLIYKYSPNVKWSTGFSIFFNDDHFPIAGASEDPTWFYIMADLKF